MERSKNMKKIFCAALIIAMVFTFASCGKDKTDTASSEVTNPVPAENSPTEAADNFIKALKARDNEALKKYYEGDVGDLTLIEGDDEPALSDMINSMLDKIMDFDYTISNEKIDGTDATVDVSIKTYDLGGILKDIIENLGSDIFALSLSGLSQEELESEVNELIGIKFKEIISSVKKDYSVTVPLKLVLKDGKWLVKDVSDSSDFMNALSGGLMDFADSLEDTMG